MPRKRILIFAPFGSWMVHHQLDAVLGAALTARGAEVLVLGCDGLFENCIIAGNPPDPGTCAGCARVGQHVFAGMGLRTLQLGKLVTGEDRAAAAAAVEASAGASLEELRYDGYPLGTWSLASMQGYFRTGSLDMGDAKVAGPMLSQLANGVLLVRALRRLLDEFRPDHVLNYNSLHFYYRVVFELCRERRLPVLVHERGLQNDSFGVLDSETMNTNEGRFRAWEPWKGIPLTRGECLEVRDYFRGREEGRHGFSRFYDFKEEGEKLRIALRIPPDGRIVALFPSGDREIGAFEATQGKTFETQIEWMRATAEICRKHGLYLVIRHHPSTVQKGLVNHPFLASVMDLAPGLHDRVRVVMPHEKLTSYSLAWAADLALTYFSTMGAEAMVRGVAGICVGDSLYRPMGAEWVREPAEYEKAILAGLERTRDFGVADLGLAYRFAHYLIFKDGYKFKSFGIKDTHSPDIRVRSLADLAAGVDPVLDRVCGHILEGAALQRLPDDGEKGRGDAEERDFLEGELAELRQRRARYKAQGHRAVDGAPVVSLLACGAAGPGCGTDPALRNSLARSREKSLQVVPLAAAGGFTAVLEGMRSGLRECRGRYAYLALPGLEIDESVFSRSADFLDREENRDFRAVRWGAWIADGEGNLTGELFTETRPAATYAEALAAWPDLQDPLRLFPFLVFRTDFLRELVDWLDAMKSFPESGIADSLFDLFHATRSREGVSPMDIPMLRLGPAPARAMPDAPQDAASPAETPTAAAVVEPDWRPAAAEAPSDSIVCYCFNRTAGQLRAAYARLGSLPAVQQETRAGTKCGGCRLILESMFGENPDEILRLAANGAGKNLCVRPGQNLMKGFIVADHRLDTVVFSSNAVPPQFADQDMTMPVEYMLLDSAGKPVLHRTVTLATNETFGFDTRKEDIPRPLYGMFLLKIGRANYGGGRFNSVWTNGVSACSTHEINDSGRPLVVLPIAVDKPFLEGPNAVYLSVQNPHAWPIRLSLQIADEAAGELDRRTLDFPPFTTRWIDASRELFAPVLARRPEARLALRIASDPMKMEFAPTIYFFLRNLATDIWNGNHL